MTLEKFLSPGKEADTYKVSLQVPDGSTFKAKILGPTEGRSWWKTEIEVTHASGRVEMCDYSRMSYRTIVQLTERKAIQKVPFLAGLLDPSPKPALTRISEEDLF